MKKFIIGFLLMFGTALVGQTVEPPEDPPEELSDHDDGFHFGMRSHFAHVNGNLVVIPTFRCSTDPRIICYDPSGYEMWSWSPGYDAHVLEWLITDTLVYVLYCDCCTLENTLHCVNLETGYEMWNVPFGTVGMPGSDPGDAGSDPGDDPVDP